MDEAPAVPVVDPVVPEAAPVVAPEPKPRKPRKPYEGAQLEAAKARMNHAREVKLARYRAREAAVVATDGLQAVAAPVENPADLPVGTPEGE